MKIPRSAAAVIAVLAVTAAALPSSSGAQREADVLTVPFPRDDGGLTPYTFRLGYPLMSLIYDTLTQRDSRGVPRPWLARSVRRTAGRVTVDLRRGVRWQDGRPLTAPDVVFTFGYVQSHPHPRFSPQLRDVERVEATGSHTVTITLKRPSLGFLDQPLADLPILPEHLWRGLPSSRRAPAGLPVGSGPYRLVEHRRGKSYRFVANRSYFRGRPLAREIHVPFIRRAQKAIAALEERRADALPVSLGPDDARKLNTGLGVRLVSGPSYLGTVLLLNTRRPPFDRREVRRAVARALDLTRIARTLSDVPAERVAVPAERGYIHPASPWAAKRDLHRFDPDAARVAIAELGIPPVEVLAPRDDPFHEKAGSEVVLALRRVGVSAVLRKLTPDQLSHAVGEEGSSPSFQAAIWTAPPLASYDPSFLGAVFGGPGAPLDYSGYSSGAFRRRFDRIASATTPGARKAATGAALARLASDAPTIPLFFREGVFAYRSAAYDRWVFVRGSGIFDKQSLLPRSRTTEAHEQPAVGDPIDREKAGDSDFPIGPFGAAALILLVAAIGYGVSAAVRGGRDGR